MNLHLKQFLFYEILQNFQTLIPHPQILKKQ